jgi:putative phosphotransacetylase
MVNKNHILTEVSARHIHISQKDLDKLFGKNYQLEIFKKLSQPGQFAAKETATLIKDGKSIKEVRIMGPVRKETQVELSKTDAKFLGMDIPLRESGKLNGTPGIEIKRGSRKIKIEKGVIIAARHLHISEKEAKELNVKNGDIINIEITGKRGVLFKNVVVRANNKSKLAFHLDTDEGNAAGINKKIYGKIIK